MKKATIICIACHGEGEVVDEESGQVYECELCHGTGRIEDDSDYTSEE